MVQICLLPVVVVLCIIIISLFHPQILEPYVTYDGKNIKVSLNPDPYIVGSDEYEHKPWHTPGGSRYYMAGGRIMPHHQDVIDHRGHSQETKYVSDVLAGNDGIIPLIEEDNVGNEYTGPSHHTPVVPEKKEGFWYNMNTLEDGGWHSGKLDDEFNIMLTEEENWRNSLIKNNIKRRGYGKGGDKTGSNLTPSEQKSFDRLAGWESDTVPIVEGFGNHRAPENWNEKDYPMITSNGIDMTPLFPQDGGTHRNIHKAPNIKKMWGEFDMLSPDDPIRSAMEHESKLKPRTEVDHKQKNN